MRLLPLAAVFALFVAFAVAGTTHGSHAGPLTATCTNPELAYTVNFPNNWFYNTHVSGEGAAEDVEACRYFSSEDFTVTPGSEPTGVSIGMSQENTAFDPSAGEEVTVGGRDAVRYESEVTTPGFEGTYYVYSIDLGDGTTLTAQTSDRWVGDYEENKDILDAMMDSLVFTATDIAASAFQAEIAWLYEQGITNGCAEDRYCPRDHVRRDQMASFLVRALDLPPASQDYFDDDDGNVHHEDNINRLAEAGITNGCAEDRYCPRDYVRRDHAASFLARALELGPASADYFTDDDGNVHHEDNINRLAEAGITNGCGENRYCPDNVLNREQMAALLYRALSE